MQIPTFKNSLSVSQPFEMTVSLTRETIPYPPPKVKAPILRKVRNKVHSFLSLPAAYGNRRRYASECIADCPFAAPAFCAGSP